MADPNPTSIQFLSRLRQQVLQEGLMSASDTRALMQLCDHPVESVREAALLLLLHPPVENEVAHFVGLVVENRSRFPLLPKKVQLALFELACDLVAILRGLPDATDLRAAVDRMVHRCSRPAAHLLLAGRFLLIEIGARSAQNLLAASSGKQVPSLRRKIRTLLARCRRPQAAWAAPTTADLSPLWSNPRTGRKQRLTRGRWLRVCRAVTAPLDKKWSGHAHSGLGSSNGLPETISETSSERRSESRNALASRISPFAGMIQNESEGARNTRYGTPFSYWGGYGPTALRYLERLLDMQAREVAAQRQLAHRISARTGRVVLSLHNATLAAMGGWGVEPLLETFPDLRQRQAFVASVLEQEANIVEHERRWAPGLDALGRLRRDRLIQPRVMQTMRELKLRSRVDPSFHDEYVRAFDLAEGLSPDDAMFFMSETGRYTLPGAVAPHQRTDPDACILWASDQLRLWKPGFIRLAALLRQGQAMLNGREITSFTVPWIDKFFISSRRDKDLAYLPAVIEWLSERGIHPLVLFWEDTAHASEPSFFLALERMKADGARFRGIGVFAADGSKRPEAERIILAEHASTTLFALRPWVDSHLPRSFHQLLRELDPRIFSSYDSAWKDNLAFLYFGTQVSMLLSHQTEMESYPPWVIVEGGKLPFGACVRQALRRKLLGEGAWRPDPFWSSYMTWANLG
ncbi:MAG: hypothetical protein AB9873_07720 [Syntrophobacteraceae bacterium]